MTPDMIDIARRAVACRRWRWVAGMAYLRRGRSHRVDPDVLSAGGSYDDTCLPDLTDPATLGCLTALAREAWGDPYLCCVGDRETGWRLDGYAAVADLHSYRSEAEALVAVLEAAP